MSRRNRWIALPVGLLIASTMVFVLMSPPQEEAVAHLVKISSGQLQGISQGDLLVFRGVPFAQPPIGALRWRAPRSTLPWNGILMADRFKPACMQPPSPIPALRIDEVNEDCLYLNLWAPAKSSADKLPVMVWLHGGGGVYGSASSQLYWGDQLAKKGVVVVNLSYRLGQFASFAHPQLTQEAEYKASGNYALLDQIAGLQWVQQNIAAFGGDPKNVTLFGQSAGAWYASKLMASPLAKGLFHRVIAQSGGDLSLAGRRDGMPRLEDAERAGLEFARSLGCETIDQLRALPAEKILAAPMPSIANNNGFTTFVDGHVIPDGPYELFASGRQTDVPLLIGYNANEGENLLERRLDGQNYVAAIHRQYQEFADRFLAEYPAELQDEAYRSQVRLRAETINWHIATWARLHAGTAQSEVYFYHFTRIPPWEPFKTIGAAHGAELSYVFGHPRNLARFTMQAPWSAYRDILVVRDIQTYWTNFAKTGDPNGPGMKTWPPFTTEEEKIIEIGNQPTIRDLPNKKEHALMDAYMKSF